MKVLLEATLAIVGILIFVLGWLPWESRRTGTHGPVRFTFLLVFSIVALGGILLVFWFVMRGR